METEDTPKKQNILQKIDGFFGKFIPSFNARAILYFSFIFAIALYLQIWRIGSHNPPPKETQETVIADDSYWNSSEYHDRIKNQTVESFTKELQDWLNGNSQEFSRRKFEDMLFINSASTLDTGGSVATIVPESFNYLENHARGRYQYAKQNGFLSDSPTLITYGNLVCDIGDRTEKDTGISLYEWRYASMPKLAAFMNTKPDWKIQIKDRILDVSDPRIEDAGLLAIKTSQSQPPGLFSFLVFQDKSSNRIYLADSEILEMNSVDARQTFSNLVGLKKQPKLYYKYGFEGCKQINNSTSSYEQFD